MQQPDPGYLRSPAPAFFLLSAALIESGTKPLDKMAVLAYLLINIGKPIGADRKVRVHRQALGTGATFFALIYLYGDSIYAQKRTKDSKLLCR